MREHTETTTIVVKKENKMSIDSVLTVGSGTTTPLHNPSMDVSVVKVKGSYEGGSIRFQEKIGSLADTDSNWETIATAQSGSGMDIRVSTPDTSVDYRFSWTGITDIGDAVLYMGP